MLNSDVLYNITLFWETGCYINHDTILSIVTRFWQYYLSVSVQILKESLKREKLGFTKEVTLGLSVFVVKFSWVGKHCKHLE